MMLSRTFLARLRLVFTFLLACTAAAYAAPKKPAKSPDTIVLTNGDTLHGTFIRSNNGTVVFTSGPLGVLKIKWSSIKELHTTEPYAVLEKSATAHLIDSGQIPRGLLNVSGQMLTVQPATHATIAKIPLIKIPIKNVRTITSLLTLKKQLGHEQGFFQGWNGAATAGGSLVTATQNQYTVTAGINLLRVSPTVNWLRRRNSTQFDFTASYGKITQPSYYDSTGTFVPAAITKTAIYHALAERDQFFTPRFFVLVQSTFDHNYSQNLLLQQIYGVGIGWTAIQTKHQQVGLKATIQYEKQQFIASITNQNQNLTGSTYSASYALHFKRFIFNQAVSYITAYNNIKAYSSNETNSFVFPAWKNLAFTLGTTDSYLNFVPATLPPSRHNSFQFTTGITYAFHSHF